MSRKQNETFRQPQVEDSLGIVIAETNFEAKMQIYWGPSQNTESAYIGPDLAKWDAFTLLSIPLVARFNFFSGSVNTEDFCPDLPPPPPPGGYQCIWKQCWAYKIGNIALDGSCQLWRVAWIHYFRNISDPGPEPACLPTGQNTYFPGITPTDDFGLPVTIFVFNCPTSGGPTTCACHPDCNIGRDTCGGNSNPNPCNAGETGFGYGCPGGGTGRC